MGQLLEILYDVLFQPSVAMRQIADKRLIAKSLAVFLLSVTLPSCAMWFGLKESGLGAVLTTAITLHIAGSLVLWFTGTAILHLIAEFYGGRAAAIGLFANLGFAQLPRILIVPLWVIAALLPETIRPFVMGLSAVVALLWVLALHVTALKATYDFGTMKAVLVMATPFLAFLVFVMATVAFVSVQVMPWPQWH